MECGCFTDNNLLIQKEKYDGQLFLIYLLGYGLGRFWIEGLRTDQLLIPGTHIAVSQVLSLAVAVVSAIILVVMSKKKKMQINNVIKRFRRKLQTDNGKG